MDINSFNNKEQVFEDSIELMMPNAECPGNTYFIHKLLEMSVFSKNTLTKLNQVGYKLYQTCNGVKSIGVKRLISALQEQFDAVAIATKCVANPNSKYFGRTVEEVVDEWSNKGAKTGLRGMGLDNYVAHVYEHTEFDLNQCSEDLLGMCKQFDIFKETVLDVTGAELVGRELWVQDTNNIKGRMDALFAINNDLIIFDWKTFEKFETSNSYGKKLLGPASHLDDCNANLATFQIYLYKYFLKKYYNIEIKSCRIGWFRPTFFKIVKPNFPYDEKFIGEVIEYCLSKI